MSRQAWHAPRQATPGQLSEGSETPEEGAGAPAAQSVKRKERRRPGDSCGLPRHRLGARPQILADRIPAGLEKIEHLGKTPLTGGSGQETDNKNSPPTQHPMICELPGSCVSVCPLPAVPSQCGWRRRARGSWASPGRGFVSTRSPDPPRSLRAPRAPRAVGWLGDFMLNSVNTYNLDVT